MYYENKCTCFRTFWGFLIAVRGITNLAFCLHRIWEERQDLLRNLRKALVQSIQLPIFANNRVRVYSQDGRSTKRDVQSALF
jgi:hypothetical protein